MDFVLGGNSLDLTLFGGIGGGVPVGSPGGSGTATAPFNLLSPTSSSSNPASSQLLLSQSNSNSNHSPYTNGRPPGSVALPGIHSVAARAAFINAGKSREESANHLCSPQNINGKRLPGLPDVGTKGNDRLKPSFNNVNSGNSNSKINNHQSHSSDHNSTSSVNKVSSVSVSSTSETAVMRVAVMNIGANRNVSSAAAGGTSNGAIYSPEPPPPPMPLQHSILNTATTNGSSNMATSNSMMGVNGGLKLPPLNSPLEHQPIHHAMLFGNVTSSSNIIPGNTSVSVGMMMPPSDEISLASQTNGVS